MRLISYIWAEQFYHLWFYKTGRPWHWEEINPINKHCWAEITENISLIIRYFLWQNLNHKPQSYYSCPSKAAKSSCCHRTEDILIITQLKCHKLPTRSDFRFWSRFIAIIHVLFVNFTWTGATAAAASWCRWETQWVNFTWKALRAAQNQESPASCRCPVWHHNICIKNQHFLWSLSRPWFPRGQVDRSIPPVSLITLVNLNGSNEERHTEGDSVSIFMTSAFLSVWQF